MSLTDHELAELLKKLDTVCREAQELQALIKRAMADRARRDMPNYGEQPARRSRPRGARNK